jgi:hypothetical protein
MSIPEDVCHLRMTYRSHCLHIRGVSHTCRPHVPSTTCSSLRSVCQPIRYTVRRRYHSSDQSAVGTDLHVSYSTLDGYINSIKILDQCSMLVASRSATSLHAGLVKLNLGLPKSTIFTNSRPCCSNAISLLWLNNLDPGATLLDQRYLFCGLNDNLRRLPSTNDSSCNATSNPEVDAATLDNASSLVRTSYVCRSTLKTCR